MDQDVDFIVPMLKFLVKIMDESPSLVVEKKRDLKKMIAQYVTLQEILSDQLKKKTIFSKVIQGLIADIENKEEEIEVFCKNWEYEMEKK